MPKKQMKLSDSLHFFLKQHVSDQYNFGTSHSHLDSSRDIFWVCYFNANKNRTDKQTKTLRDVKVIVLTLHTHGLPPYMKFLGLLFSCWLKKKKEREMGRQIQKCDIKIIKLNNSASFWWALILNSKWKYVSITSSCFSYHGRHSHCSSKWEILA